MLRKGQKKIWEPFGIFLEGSRIFPKLWRIVPEALQMLSKRIEITA